MRLRPHRRNIVVWSSSAAPAGESRGVRGLRGTPPTRIRRMRRRLRIGALLMVLGVLWLARTARICWEPLSLIMGVLLAIVGLERPSVGGFFLLGLLVLIVTLVKGISGQQHRRDPAG